METVDVLMVQDDVPQRYFNRRSASVDRNDVTSVSYTFLNQIL